MTVNWLVRILSGSFLECCATLSAAEHMPVVLETSSPGYLQASSTVLLLTLLQPTAAKPSAEQLEIARHARGLKIYIYDLAAAGLSPALTTVAPESAACATDACVCHPRPGNSADLCNYSFGRPVPAPWAAALQVRRLCRVRPSAT